MSNTAGELNKRITFQENHPIKISTGYKDNWVDVKTVWGSIKPLSSREFFMAQQATSEITTKIKVRYNKLLDNDKLRAVWNGKVFNLEAPINPNYSDIELIFMAKVKSNEQHI